MAIREPEMCERALQSLQQLLQSLDTDTLAQEPYALIRRVFDALIRLRRSGGSSAGVRLRASTCLVALAVAHGLPELLLLAVQSLWCDHCDAQSGTAAATTGDTTNRNMDSDEEAIVVIPDNLRQYNVSTSAAASGVCWLAIGITDNNAFVECT